MSPQRKRAAPKPARRGRTAKVAVRRGTTMLETDRRRRLEYRVAPPKQAERQHARPGAGIKRARAVMVRRPR
jgi:hypothetical protein